MADDEEDKSEIDELKKLSPEQRIKKARELEEKTKKELEEAEKLIKSSEDELEEKRKVETLHPTEIEERAVDRAFEGEQLEETVQKEQPKATDEEVAQQSTYDIGKLSKAPINELNERLQYFDEMKSQYGSLTQQQQAEAKNIGSALYEKADATPYKTGGEKAQEMGHSQKMVKDLLGYDMKVGHH